MQVPLLLLFDLVPFHQINGELSTSPIPMATPAQPQTGQVCCPC